MKRVWLGVVCVIGMTLLLAACGQTAATPVVEGPPETGPASTHPSWIGNAVEGKAKFQSTCVACHGVDARGIPNLGKDLTTSPFVRAQSDAELIAFLKMGRRASDKANTTGVEMPAKGGNPAFSERDLADIVSYIRSLSR